MRTTSSSSSSSSFRHAEAGTVNSHSQSLSRGWQRLDCKHYDDKYEFSWFCVFLSFVHNVFKEKYVSSIFDAFSRRCPG